jgi:glycerol-3-phosphate dehydrogenase (NAD(P)+)
VTADAVEIAVIGTGAWGTALAALLAGAGHRTVLVARSAQRAADLAANRRNARLPDAALPGALGVAATVPDAGLFLLCPPFQHLRATLARLPAGDAPIVLCCKGVETGSCLLAPEIAAECVPGRPCAVLTGPNFAHEIAAGLPAAAVLASHDSALVRQAIHLLSTPRFRLYGSADPLGAALGGAAKNVIAIAAGVVTGAGLGENARAALITRGLAEIARLSTALGGAPETASGLAGLGDLILTATGGASRNFRAGLALGRGGTPPSDPHGPVVEGVATAPALLARARAAGCEMPVSEAVTDLLAGRIGLAAAMDRLLRRRLRERE